MARTWFEEPKDKPKAKDPKPRWPTAADVVEEKDETPIYTEVKREHED